MKRLSQQGEWSEEVREQGVLKNRELSRFSTQYTLQPTVKIQRYDRVTTPSVCVCVCNEGFI